MLGESEVPKYNIEKYKKRFTSKEEYYDLIDSVFNKCSRMMKRKSVIYVRTDKRNFTLNTTIDELFIFEE